MIELPCFDGAPTSGKLAKAGRWEDAVAFQPGGLTTTSDVLPHLGRSREVACEAFFGSAFFGVRRRGTTTELARFVVAFAHALGSAGSGRDFFGAITRDLGLALETDFRFAELGAEGGWATVGPVRIPDPCSALAHLDRLWRDLEASPLARDTAHEKALEFTYGGGGEHWFALPVSESGTLVAAHLRDGLRAFCR